MMYMVWLHFSEMLADEVTGILDAAGVEYYSVWRDVLWRDNMGENTRWDDAVFPGKNWSAQFLCPPEIVNDLKRRLDVLMEDPFVKDSGIVMYLVEAERGL
ncbi:MAG: PG0541 family transporter-associated protein [Aminobacteriaceae bacterium]